MRMSLSLFTGIWVSRYLGAEQFGMLSYAHSIVILFSAISTLGLDKVVIRDLVNQESKRDILLGTSFTLKAFGAVAVIIILTISVLFISKDRSTGILIIIIAGSTIFQSFNVVDFYFQSKVLSRYVVYANFISTSIISITKILLIIWDAPLISFAWTVFFESFILAIGLIYCYYSNKLSITKWEFNKALSKTLLQHSWPLLLSGIAVSVALRIDQIMIKPFLDSTNVGLYAVGVRLAEAFNFLPMIIGQSLYPKILNISLSKARQKLVLLFRYILLGLVILAIIINLLSKYIVLLLFGDEYMDAYKVLDILIWGIPSTFLGIMSNHLLLKSKNERITFFKQSLLMILNIAFNFVLIPIYGIIGAGLATLTADAVVNLFFEAFFKKIRWIFKIKIDVLFFSKTE